MVLEKRVLHDCFEFMLREVLGIVKKEFLEFIIDFMKMKRQLMDEKLMRDSTNVIFMEGRRLKMNL